MKTSVQDSSLPDLLRDVESRLAISNPVNLEVDARDLACPLPLLKARQAIRNIAVGESVRVLATDAGSLKDFASFAQLTGQLIEGFCSQDNYYCFVIRKQL